MKKILFLICILFLLSSCFFLPPETYRDSLFDKKMIKERFATYNKKTNSPSNSDKRDKYDTAYYENQNKSDSNSYITNTEDTLNTNDLYAPTNDDSNDTQEDVIYYDNEYNHEYPQDSDTHAFNDEYSELYSNEYNNENFYASEKQRDIETKENNKKISYREWLEEDIPSKQEKIKQNINFNSRKYDRRLCIVKHDISLKQYPLIKANDIAILKSGTKGIVVQTDFFGFWVKIRTKNYSGWLRRSYISFIHKRLAF